MFRSLRETDSLLGISSTGPVVEGYNVVRITCTLEVCLVTVMFFVCIELLGYMVHIGSIVACNRKLMQWLDNVRIVSRVQ